MAAISTHLLHDVEAVAFVGNDVIDCRTFEVGTDSVSIRVSVARAADSFVRLQCHLDPQHWLDADAVLTDCRKFGNEWHWRLSFVNVREPSPMVFNAFVHQRPKRSSPTHSPPARESSVPPPAPERKVPRPPSSAPPPEARSRSGESPDQAPVGRAELEALFREALREVEGKR